MASRYEKLRRWMRAHAITFAAIARQTGAGTTTIQIQLAGETMPVHRHKELVALGFPPELLPRAQDLKRGPRPVQPDFPGLREGAGA